MRRAVELYRGEFLEGLSLPDNAAFEEWVSTERERLHQQALLALASLTEFHLRRHEFALAVEYAQRQIALEAWREEAHRQLMTALAFSGERSRALAQFQVCEKIVRQEMGMEPSAATKELYAAIQANTLQLRPVLVHIPAQLSSFVGREAEQKKISALLDQSDCRLITILGAGGGGKTRLAIQAAMQHAGSFADGVYFVDLAAINAPDLIAPAIASALDLDLRDAPDPRARLFDHLREKEMLLVLDNLEHLLDKTRAEDGAEFVAQMLKRAPKVVCLITSRTPLNLRGENRFQIEGLPYPSADSAKTDEPLPSLRLFEARARQVQPTFALTPATLPAVSRVCRLVQGLPLAIELAAVRVRAYSCEKIAEAISQNIDFLAATTRDVPERQQSLRATLEYSWGLLSQPAQGALRRLSVFQDAFALNAAEFVAEATVELLGEFLEIGLLAQSSAEQFRIHEAVRQFLSEKLDADQAETLATWEKRYQYHLRVADAAAKVSDNQVADWNYFRARESLTHLPESFENHRKRIEVFDQQFRMGMMGTGEAVPNLKMLEEEERFLSQALTPTPDPQLRQLFARVHSMIGLMHHYLGNPAQAIHYFAQALSTAQELGDLETVQSTHVAMGQAMCLTGRMGKAVRMLRVAISTMEKAGDWVQWHLAMMYYSDALVLVGECREGIAQAERAYARAQADGYLGGMAQGALGRFLTCLDAGFFERAQTSIEKAIELNEQAKKWLNVVVLYETRGLLDSRAGLHDVARAHWEKGQEIWKIYESNSRHRYDWLTTYRAMIALDAGEIDQAIHYALEALAGARLSDDLLALGRAHRILAIAGARQQPPQEQESETHFAESVRAFEEGEVRLEVARTHAEWGKVLFARGNLTAARERLEKAAQQFELSELENELREVREYLAGINP
ncbi:MAG: AAA family ATPase [Chloroflexi bacterium]|nr:AAA family ATPase [Chloroflexota bacterium]